MVARIECDVCHAEVEPGRRTLLHAVCGELQTTHPAIDACPSCVEKLRRWIEGGELEARPLEASSAR